MLSTYTKIYIKRNLLAALVCAVICFIPLFVVSLIYDVRADDTLIAWIPFPAAALCFGVSLLPIIPFRHMVRKQEALYRVAFTDTDVKRLDTTLYISRTWLIHAGRVALCKQHIRKITAKQVYGKGGVSYRITVKTADNRRLVIRTTSASAVKQIQAWIRA